jgi:hypothetical protein
MKALLKLTLLTVLLCACARPEPGCARLPNGGQYCLQATSFAPAFSVRQQVVARFKDQREMLIADIENRQDGLDFVGLTPFGLTVFQASYDNHTAKAARLPDARLSPELLLSMLQLALWPADAVRRGLGGDAEVQDGPGMRRIFVRKELLMELKHDASPIPYQRMQINWPTLDMSLDIRALVEQEAP